MSIDIDRLDEVVVALFSHSETNQKQHVYSFILRIKCLLDPKKICLI